MQDGNWNTVAICDITGFVGERYAYSAYGTPVFMNDSGIVQTSSAIGFETLYAGYRWDGTTPQMYYVRNRFLLPMIGTWNRRDPLGYIGRMNLYGLNRAISATDPSGLQEVSVTFSPTSATQVSNVYVMRLPNVMKDGKSFTRCGTVKKCVSFKRSLKDCKAGDKKGVMLKIDVHIEFVMILNPDCFDRDDWRRTFGHEQRHIRNEIALYQQNVALLEQEIEKYYAAHPESHVNGCTPCKNASERKKITGLVDEQLKLWQINFDDNYGPLLQGMGGAHPLDPLGPEEGKPYDPLEGTNIESNMLTHVRHSIKNTIIPKGTSPCARGILKEIGGQLDDQSLEALQNAGGGFLLD